MRREFREETGADVPTWHYVLRFHDARGYLVHFFGAELNERQFIAARTMTDEELHFVATPLSSLDGGLVIPNLRWLLPMVQGRLRGLDPVSFVVTEVAAPT